MNQKCLTGSVVTLAAGEVAWWAKFGELEGI